MKGHKVKLLKEFVLILFRKKKDYLILSKFEITFIFNGHLGD